MKAAIRIDADLVAAFRRDYRIEMCCQGNERPFDAGIEKRDHIAGPVDVGFAAITLELPGEPLGAQMLDKGRRRDTAKLEVYLVDPLLFAGEPLERLAHTYRLSQVANRGGERQSPASMPSDRRV